MGFFSGFDIGDAFDPGSFVAKKTFGEDSGVFKTVNIAGDPLDLTGTRAEIKAGEIADLQAQAAREGLDAQGRQIERVTDLFDPFAEAGQQPLSELVGAFTGDEPFQFNPSEAFGAGIEQGTRGVRRGAAARGGLDSSGTEARLADLVNSLTGQEVQKQIEERLQPIRTAQDAEAVIANQVASSAGAGSTIFDNLASGQVANAANLGAARSSSFDSLGSGLAGLAQFAAAK